MSTCSVRAVVSISLYKNMFSVGTFVHGILDVVKSTTTNLFIPQDKTSIPTARQNDPYRAILEVKYVRYILGSRLQNQTAFAPEGHPRKLALRVTWPSFGNTTVSRHSVEILKLCAGLSEILSMVFSQVCREV
jgi:hypothetical protein